MEKRGDYQLDPFEEHGTIDLADELATGDSRDRRIWLGVLILVVLALAGIGAWYWFARRAAPPPLVAAPPPVVQPTAEPVEPEAVDLPALTDSDTWLRDVVGQLSAHPQLGTWLLNDGLIERLVAAVANVAEGESPAAHLRFLRPSGPFAVARRAGRLFVDPAAYHRYDTLATVIASLHVDGTAQVYRNVKPLLDEAYRNLGYPDGDFDDVAVRAVRRLLDTPVVETAEVEGDSIYAYVDDRLEGLDEAQKHFLRLGPDNLMKVQNQVRRIARRAGLAVD
jgi:Protein of unknown function (DUF3014)